MNHCETASSLSKDNESRTKCVEERERERKAKRERKRRIHGLLLLRERGNRYRKRVTTHNSVQPTLVTDRLQEPCTT